MAKQLKRLGRTIKKPTSDRGKIVTKKSSVERVKKDILNPRIMRKTYSGMGGQFKAKLKGSPKTKKEQAAAAVKSFKQKLKKGKIKL